MSFTCTVSMCELSTNDVVCAIRILLALLVIFSVRVQLSANITPPQLCFSTLSNCSSLRIQRWISLRRRMIRRAICSCVVLELRRNCSLKRNFRWVGSGGAPFFVEEQLFCSTELQMRRAKCGLHAVQKGAQILGTKGDIRSKKIGLWNLRVFKGPIFWIIWKKFVYRSWQCYKHVVFRKI
jgi:hypothetical protein